MVQMEQEEMAGGNRRPDITPDEALREVRDRTRRMETRLTGYMQWQGYDTGSERPSWRQGVEGIIDVPTPGASLRDILAAIPEGWDREQEVEVHHRGAWIASVVLPEA